MAARVERDRSVTRTALEVFRGKYPPEVIEKVIRDYGPAVGWELLDTGSVPALHVDSTVQQKTAGHVTTFAEAEMRARAAAPPAPAPAPVPSAPPAARAPPPQLQAASAPPPAASAPPAVLAPKIHTQTQFQTQAPPPAAATPSPAARAAAATAAAANRVPLATAHSSAYLRQQQEELERAARAKLEAWQKANPAAANSPNTSAQHPRPPARPVVATACAKESSMIGEVRRHPELAGLPPPAAAESTACNICGYDEAPLYTVPCGHHWLCYEDMYRQITVQLGERRLPTCPLCVETVYELSEADLTDFLSVYAAENAECRARVPQLFALQLDLFKIKALVSMDDAVPCPGPNCTNWVIRAAPNIRSLVDCAACGYQHCSVCRVSPYHFTCECADVGGIREEYGNWIMHGRESYYRQMAERDHSFADQLANYETQRARHQAEKTRLEQIQAQFEADEDYKKNNCRLCPNCGRLVEHMGGCSSMVCGSDYHGGNDQNGCGAGFTWDAAAPYTPEANRSRLVGRFNVLPPAHATLKPWVDARGDPIICSFCDRPIVGPKFRCINCSYLVVCLNCECTRGASHADHHVFQIFMPEVVVDITRNQVLWIDNAFNSNPELTQFANYVQGLPEALGFTVVDDTPQALRFTGPRNDVCCVITNLRRPSSDRAGFEVTRQIREQAAAARRPPPFIVMYSRTAANTPSIAAECARSNIAIAKSLRELLEIILSTGPSGWRTALERQSNALRGGS